MQTGSGAETQILENVKALIRTSSDLHTYLRKNDEKIDKINKSVNVLNNMLVKPVETFESLILEALKLK